jgi:solute carrier family 38 (sodium-coupled neutral amino acid transporter), member 11
MAKDTYHSVRKANARDEATDGSNNDGDNEETRELLSSGSGSSEEDDDDDIIVHEGHTVLQQPTITSPTPRTPNRVRFQLDELPSIRTISNGHPPDDSWADEEDFLADNAAGAAGRSRAPLLTGIEAPSVTVATDYVDVVEVVLGERRRPKSGMRMAFMNMANSIM